MSQVDRPQIYLITPAEFELSTFAPKLAGVLDAHAIGCVRLAMATKDEDRLSRAADLLRETCHARDVAIVIDTHVQLVERLGLDGVHVNDGAKSIRALRKEFGADPIIGSFCGTSRHDGMTAGESGADYVSFGPVGQTPLGTGESVELELFQWWSEMIEVPIVAEGALDVDLIRALTPYTDFFALGHEVWSHEDAVARMGALIAAMG